MSNPASGKPRFFTLPYDVRLLIYIHLFAGRSYVSIAVTDANGDSEIFLGSSHELNELFCLFTPSIPSCRTPDLRLLLTSKAFYAEAGAVARQLWLRNHQRLADYAELLPIATLIRTPAVESLGRLARVRLVKEASARFLPKPEPEPEPVRSAEGEATAPATSGAAKEHICFVETIPPPGYVTTRVPIMPGQEPMLVVASRLDMGQWARESVDELDYAFYQGVLRTVRRPAETVRCEVGPLEFFGRKGTGGRWLVQDCWRASEPELVVPMKRLRAVLEWEGDEEGERAV